MCRNQPFVVVCLKAVGRAVEQLLLNCLVKLAQLEIR